MSRLKNVSLHQHREASSNDIPDIRIVPDEHSSPPSDSCPPSLRASHADLSNSTNNSDTEAEQKILLNPTGLSPMYSSETALEQSLQGAMQDDSDRENSELLTPPGSPFREHLAGMHGGLNSKWAKVRTSVKVAGAVQTTTTARKRPRKGSTLVRQDSFLKRFSTRHGGGTNNEDGYTDEETAKQNTANKENDRHLRFVVNPDENVMFVWLGIITVAVLYNLWTGIAREAFKEIQKGYEPYWLTMDAVCDLLYLCDIAVQLRTGYLEKGLIVYSTKKLACHYVFARYFMLDLISLLPLDLLQFYIGIHPLIRFPRFIKVYRSYRFAYMVETRTIYPNMWRVANLSHVLFLGSHWFAAFYFMISKAEGFIGNWGYPKPEGEFATVARQYLKSLYWSTLTLTTIGDLPPPESNWEWLRTMPSHRYVFTIVSYLIGVFVFATIVGQVGNVITNRNASRQEFERLLDSAKAYMRNHNVPAEMQRRVQRWYDYAWSRGRMNGGGDINSLGLLPDKLKTELALHVNLGTLKKVTIFQECEPEFLHDLVLKMRAFIFTPGDLICRKGEVAREMFIIADGLLEVISDQGEVLTQMTSGDFFGEIGILNLDGGVNRRTADVRSVGYSELFVLSREDVLSALKDHPEAEAILTLHGRKRLIGIRQKNAQGDLPGHLRARRPQTIHEEEANPSPITNLLGVRLSSRKRLRYHPMTLDDIDTDLQPVINSLISYLQALIKAYGRKRLQEIEEHRRQREINQRNKANNDRSEHNNSKECSPVHKMVNSSADLLQKVIKLGRKQSISADNISALGKLPDKPGLCENDLSMGTLLQKVMALGRQAKSQNHMEQHDCTKPLVAKVNGENPSQSAGNLTGITEQRNNTTNTTNTVPPIAISANRHQDSGGRTSPRRMPTAWGLLKGGTGLGGQQPKVTSHHGNTYQAVHTDEAEVEAVTAEPNTNKPAPNKSPTILSNPDQTTVTVDTEESDLDNSPKDEDVEGDNTDVKSTTLVPTTTTDDLNDDISPSAVTDSQPAGNRDNRTAATATVVSKFAGGGGPRVPWKQRAAIRSSPKSVSFDNPVYAEPPYNHHHQHVSEHPPVGHPHLHRAQSEDTVCMFQHHNARHDSTSSTSTTATSTTTNTAPLSENLTSAIASATSTTSAPISTITIPHCVDSGPLAQTALPPHQQPSKPPLPPNQNDLLHMLPDLDLATSNDAERDVLADVSNSNHGDEQKLELIPFPMLPMTNGDLPRRASMHDAATSDHESHCPESPDNTTSINNSPNNSMTDITPTSTAVDDVTSPESPPTPPDPPASSTALSHHNPPSSAATTTTTTDVDPPLRQAATSVCNSKVPANLSSSSTTSPNNSPKRLNNSSTNSSSHNRKEASVARAAAATSAATAAARPELVRSAAVEMSSIDSDCGVGSANASLGDGGGSSVVNKDQQQSSHNDVNRSAVVVKDSPFSDIMTAMNVALQHKLAEYHLYYEDRICQLEDDICQKSETIRRLQDQVKALEESLAVAGSSSSQSMMDGEC